MSDLASVAVVIVTYNSGSQLGRCIDSLRDGCAGVRLVDVVVADNDSSDDSVTVAEKPRDVPVRMVQLGRNGGFAAAINGAIATMDTTEIDCILILNPDIAVLPGSVAVLAGALRTPGRAIAAPRLLNTDGSVQPSLRREPTLRRALAEAVLGGPLASRIGDIGELIFDPVVYERPGAFAWTTGAAMLVSTDAAAALGPWDESFLLYGEETEYAVRAGDRGWQTWYEPAAVMEHVGGTHTVTNPRMYALQTVNKLRLYRMRHDRVASAAYHVVITLGELLRALIGRPGSSAAVEALVRPSRRLRALPHTEQS